MYRFFVLLSCLYLIGCSSIESEVEDIDSDDSDVLKEITVDFDELEIDIDSDGGADLFGKLYRNPNDQTELFCTYGLLFTDNGWHILSKRDLRKLDIIDFPEIWPLYKGDSIYRSADKVLYEVDFYHGNESLAFVGKAEINNRKQVLASGNLTSGKEQYVALMKVENGQKHFAWVDISVNPILDIQWEDESSGLLGYDYYCETRVGEIFYQSVSESVVFAGKK